MGEEQKVEGQENIAGATAPAEETQTEGQDTAAAPEGEAAAV